MGLVAERELQGKGEEKDAFPRRKRPQRSPETHVASALRSAYEQTVRESVPDEFLDLLGKLS